jgi:hypothetical protein
MTPQCGFIIIIYLLYLLLFIYFSTDNNTTLIYCIILDCGNIVLQGDTWGSILASVQVDSIGKDIEEAGLRYLYKESLPVSLLGLVDDVIGVTGAGYKAQQMNVILNVKSTEKCLQFGV